MQHFPNTYRVCSNYLNTTNTTKNMIHRVITTLTSCQLYLTTLHSPYSVDTNISKNIMETHTITNTPSNSCSWTFPNHSFHNLKTFVSLCTWFVEPYTKNDDSTNCTSNTLKSATILWNDCTSTAHNLVARDSCRSHKKNSTPQDAQ
jgi:hypothetical protein